MARQVKIEELGRNRQKEIHYFSDSSRDEYYYQNNRLHREEGPAEIWFDEKNKKTRGKFYLKGKQLSEYDWLKKIPLKEVTIETIDELEKIANKEKQEINHIDDEGVSYIITDKIKYVYYDGRQ